MAEDTNTAEREAERKAFKTAHRHLELDEMPDAWGRPMFKHSHVEASWLGWQARASLAASAGSEPVAQVKDWAAGARFALEQVAKIDHICWLTDSMREIGITRAGKAVLEERDRLIAAHPSPPEGMAMVPMTLTPGMKRAAMDLLLDGLDIYVNAYDQVEIQTTAPARLWAAMIAAAPPLPASEAKEL